MQLNSMQFSQFVSLITDKKQLVLVVYSNVLLDLLILSLKVCLVYFFYYTGVEGETVGAFLR